MTLYESVRAVASASGEDAIDWNAVAAAAKAAIDPGSLALSEAEEEGYAADVRAARARVREVSGLDFDVPATVEIQNRHHWIDANVSTFERVFEPLNKRPAVLPGATRRVNTASTAAALAFIARNVLGQYDPLLLADGDDHALYFVHPNIRRVAADLDVSQERFRRWIAFHEVTHAAEFGAAPWLSAYLADRMQDGIRELERDQFAAVQGESFRDLNLAMTAVEGYAELLMDEAFDGEYADLRRKLDERRQSPDPLTGVIRRLLGFQLKRQQYERGRAFFDRLVAERGLEGASVVWDDPANLPRADELEEPARWLARVPAP